MSSEIQLARCPYCNKKISYFAASLLRKEGEYTCKSCTCTSNIVLNKAIYGIASGACVLALLITVLYTAMGDHGNLIGIVYVLIPFLIFYILAPFFVMLVPHKEKGVPKKVAPRQEVRVQERVYEKPVKYSASENPIELDVDEDFSAKFIKAKNNSSSKIQGNEELSRGTSPEEPVNTDEVIAEQTEYIAPENDTELHDDHNEEMIQNPESAERGENN